MKWDRLKLFNIVAQAGNITRASEMFDYKPIYDIRAGVKDYIELMNKLGLSRSPE